MGMIYPEGWEPVPPPLLSYSECIDKLFALWIESGDGQTFEEFITPRE